MKFYHGTFDIISSIRFENATRPPPPCILLSLCTNQSGTYSMHHARFIIKRATPLHVPKAAAATSCKLQQRDGARDAPRSLRGDKWQARLVGKRVCRKIYWESNERSEQEKGERTVMPL